MVQPSRRKDAGPERSYTLTLPLEVYNAVQRIALREGRSMNMQLRRMVTEDVERDRHPARSAA